MQLIAHCLNPIEMTKRDEKYRVSQEPVVCSQCSPPRCSQHRWDVCFKWPCVASAFSLSWSEQVDAVRPAVVPRRSSYLILSAGEFTFETFALFITTFYSRLGWKYFPALRVLECASSFACYTCAFPQPMYVVMCRVTHIYINSHSVACFLIWLYLRCKWPVIYRVNR